MHPDQSQRKTVLSQSALPLAAAVIANIALAFGPWFVRLADTGPVASAFWRMTLAGPLLFAAAGAIRQPPLRHARGLGIALLVSGIIFAADLAAWHLGIVLTTLANATLFGNVAALLFPIYGFIVARSWPSRQQGIALALAAAGGGLLLGRSAQLSPEHLAGDLLCVLAGLFYALYFVVMARVRAAMAPLPALALSTLASIVPLFVVAVMLGERIVPTIWAPLVGIAIVSQLIGQLCMIYALGHLTPLVIGIALLIQPAVAAAIGWIVYDERLALPDLIGAVLVAAALVLVRGGARPPLATARAEAQKAIDD